MTNADSGGLELLVLVLYKTEVYNKLLYALNDAGIPGATTVSSSGWHMSWPMPRTATSSLPFGLLPFQTEGEQNHF